jgi:hypothetical protein
MNKKIVLPSLLIAFGYLAVLVYLININLVRTTLSGSYPLSYKVSLMSSLLGGLGATMSGASLIAVLLIAILTGFNLSLAFSQLKRGRLKKKSDLTFFSGAAFGLLGSGCGACGLPVLSVFGISGSFLPFRGLEFSFLAIGLLLVSLIFLLRTRKLVCKLKT